MGAIVVEDVHCRQMTCLLTETWELEVFLSQSFIYLPFLSGDRAQGQDEGKGEHLPWAARGHWADSGGDRVCTLRSKVSCWP